MGEPSQAPRVPNFRLRTLTVLPNRQGLGGAEAQRGLGRAPPTVARPARTGPPERQSNHGRAAAWRSPCRIDDISSRIPHLGTVPGRGPGAAQSRHSSSSARICRSPNVRIGEVSPGDLTFMEGRNSPYRVAHRLALE